MGIRPITGQELHKETNMGKMSGRQKYIHNLAGTILGSNHVYPKDPAELFKWYGSNVSDKIEKFGDETLGKIAACGLSIYESGATGEFTTIYEVRSSAPLLWMKNGRSLLLEIATASVIAAMMDIIRARTKKSQSA
ncbi:MAG: hypothetical protein Q8P23_04240 [bacterium]|nr:hypothetical protein [bacterium]